MLGRGRAQTAGMGQPGTEQVQAPNSAQAAESMGWANANDSSKFVKLYYLHATP